MTKKQRKHCATILLWYDEHKRDLPWRRTRDPYRILVSEVMLQQTQVSRVIEKYNAFLRAFPNTKQLAEARTADVITAWKGLGYNRRALFLQRTAIAVRNDFGGRFPKTREELLTLPGVGAYTARAILSFAFGQSTPVLDTNHRKFYQKTFFGDTIQTDVKLLTKAEEVVDWIETEYGLSRVYDWNQALMDWVSANTQDYTLPRKPKKKRPIPFKDTDRYIRGNIIDMLRETQKIGIATLRRIYSDIDDDRFTRIIENLKKDQLIVQEKRSIVLPT